MAHALRRAKERHAEFFADLLFDQVGRICAEAVQACPLAEALVLPTDNRPQLRQVGVPVTVQGRCLGYLILDQDREWSGPRAVAKTFVTPEAWQIKEAFEAQHPTWYLQFRDATEGNHPSAEKL